MSSLEKALDILSCFSIERPVLAVSAVAQELAMPKSSVSRLMKAMANAGLLEQEQGRRGYTPGILAFQLGNLYQKHLKVLDLVEEAVADLVERFGVTGYIGVMNGTDVVLISVRQGSYPIRMVLEKGTRVPAQVTAIGLALLARSSDEEIRSLYPGAVRYDETGLTVNAQDIIAQVEAVRRQGYAAVEGSTFRGFNALSVAVESVTERQRIGFSVSYPQELLRERDMSEIIDCVVGLAEGIGVRSADPYWVARAAAARPGKRADAPAPLHAPGGA